MFIAVLRFHWNPLVQVFMFLAFILSMNPVFSAEYAESKGALNIQTEAQDVFAYRWLRSLLSKKEDCYGLVKIVELKNPVSIAINNDGNIIVLDTSTTSLILLNSDFEPVGYFAEDRISTASARAVAVNSGGEIIVTYAGDKQDMHGFRIFSKNGELVKEISGERDSGLGQFDSPCGVSLGKGDRIFVPDSGNHRIQVFSSGGEFLYESGRKGDDLDEFKSPSYATVDGRGYMYVADTGNNRIHVMEPAETSYITIQLLNGLKSPVSLAVDSNGWLYVSNTGGNSIEVYRTDESGDYAHTGSYTGPDERGLNEPAKILLDDKNQRLIIADSGNSRVLAVPLENLQKSSDSFEN